MADREPKTPKGSRWGRLSRQASFWVFLFLLPVLILQMMGTREKGVEQLTYSQFRRELDRENVVRATVIAGDQMQQVQGELKTPITVPTPTGETRQVDKFTANLPGRDSEALVDQMYTSGVLVNADRPQRDWTSMFWAAFPWLIIIGVWFLILRQMQNSGNKAFQFGKSKAKLLSGDTPKVTFDDVSGADEAKYELQEIVEFLKDPKKFSRLGGRIPKGALLVGPPGTGKTLLARAVAGEAGRPFFSMSGSDFVEMFVGVGASRVRDLFEQGKAHAPCIIFIDEIDAVGRHRGAGLGGGHDEREQTLNQLLVEMDGFEANDGVILIAATNRPDVLDPALLRPGRFDRQVVVDSPDVKGREGILRVHLKKVPAAPDVNVAVLARGTPGMSGADLANLVNEGALLAARKGHDSVYMADLEEAKDKVMLGAERKSMVLSDAEKKLTAYHEAGHAVVALRFPGLDPVHKVTIIPRGRALGITASLPEEDRHSYSRDYLIARLVMLFGGRVAEEMIFGAEKVTTGAGNDIERATALARRMVTQFGMSEAIGPMAIGDSEQEVFLGRDIGQRRQVSEQTAQLVDAEVKRLLDEAIETARRILRENEALMEAIALALLERETLDRDEVEMLEQGKTLPPVPLRPAVSPPPPPAPPSPRPSEDGGIGGLSPSPSFAREAVRGPGQPPPGGEGPRSSRP
jgi:cell division protease FtsH